MRAQTVDPGDVFNPIEPNPQTLPTPLPTPIPQSSPEELLQTPPLPAIPSEDPSAYGPETICIKGFDFEGNTVFSAQQLNQVIREKLNLTEESSGCIRINFLQVIQARSIVTQLYIGNDYLGSFAYIPENQEVPTEGGTIEIKVVEGELEGDIRVSGTKRLNPDYVRSRLAIAASAPLNQERLLEALRLLQLNPLIKKVNAELSPGSEPGKAILVVNIEEAQSFDTQISIDNNRSPSVGSFRGNLSVSEGNLLGLGDSLTTTYKHTDGSDEFDVSYTVPFNPYNGTVGLRYRTGSGNVTEPPFDKLDLASNYRSYELTLRQPVIQRADGESVRELALGLTASRQESDTSILGVQFPLSPGGDEKGRTRISALRFFQEWTQRSSKEVLAARSEFSLGVGWFNATINGSDPFTGEEIPDSRFFVWRGQVQWLHLLERDTTLLLRTSIQLADRSLVPFEQFGLGGQDTVRGYRQDAQLTDSGIFASAELQMPIYRIPRQQGVLSIIPFIDVGTGWNSSGRDTPDPSTLVGVGLGLQWRQDRFRARLDWGIPLVNIDSRDRTWQENGVYFSVEYNLF